MSKSVYSLNICYGGVTYKKALYTSTKDFPMLSHYIAVVMNGQTLYCPVTNDSYGKIHAHTVYVQINGTTYWAVDSYSQYYNDWCNATCDSNCCVSDCCDDDCCVGDCCDDDGCRGCGDGDYWDCNDIGCGGCDDDWILCGDGSVIT